MLVSYVDPHSLPAKVPLATLEATFGRNSPHGPMTDFSSETPVCVSPGRHIDDALQDMIHAGIRSLLVVEEAAVVGLITAADILGTRPIQFLQSHLCESHPCLHRDVHVGDIMTPWAQLRLLDYYRVAAASASDLADSFCGTELTHLIVIERTRDGTSQVRGLLSKSRLLRELGVKSNELAGITL